MKLYFLLFFLYASDCSAQLNQSQFDATMQQISSNDQKKVLATLESLEKKMPNDSKVIFLRGMYSFRDGDLNLALLKFSNAINADANFALAYASRGQVLALKGKLDKAISDVSIAIKIEPKNADFTRLRSSIYNQNNQIDKAFEDVKILIVLEPNNIMGYYDAAVFSKLIDKNYDADQFFTQAYGNKAITKYVTDVLFAKFLLVQNRFEEAKVKYEAALLVAENEFGDEDFHNAALVFYKTKEYDKAVLYFNKAITLNPAAVNYYTNLASVYTDLKDWQKVKETAQKALSADDKNPMANMYMAIGLKFTGHETEAIEYQNKAKKLEEEQKNN